MIFRFYPKKDATIYEQYPDKNAGLDAVLDISKNIVVTSSYNSRILVDFDYTAASASIVGMGMNPNNFNWRLKLYATDGSEIPLEYNLECYPISQSWNMGIGRYDNSPETTEGVSWNYREGKTVTSTTWKTSSFAAGSTGSYVVNRGGGTWYTASLVTQSFTYLTSNNAADIDMDVTSIIRQVQSGSINFQGFLIKKTYTDESSSLSFSSLKFFSKDTHTVYSPVLEAGYDNATNAGSLTTIQTDQDYNVQAINLPYELKESSTPRLRFSARYRFPTPSFSTSSLHLDRYALPTGSQYAIYSAETDDIVVNFSNFTKISDDGTSNYFDLVLDNFQPERYYKILIKVPNNSGYGYLVHDNNWVFKVARNQ